MTRFIDRKTNWSKVVTVALTGASLTVPMFTAASAQADSFVPGAGYSQVQYRNRDRGYNNENANQTTITGRVTQDLDGDRFQIRADNGQTFIVNLRGQGSASIREGRRVRVTGLRNGNRIRRASVQVLSSGYNNRNRNDRYNDDYDYNDNNRNRNRNRNRDRNDRYNDDDNETVSFVGTVRSSRVTGPGRMGIVVVETGNGRTFRVLSNDAAVVEPGSRIRVRGVLENGVVVNNQVDPA
jgi:translation initiation factor IF-1